MRDWKKRIWTQTEWAAIQQVYALVGDEETGRAIDWAITKARTTPSNFLTWITEAYRILVAGKQLPSFPVENLP